MTRPMKWHIYYGEHQPLCWEDQAFEFDTREAAEKLWASIEDYHASMLVDSIIVEDILYYDGGYINATDCEYIVDSFGNEFIIEVKEKN